MSLPKLAQLEFDVDDLTDSVENNRNHTTLNWDFESGDFKLRDGKFVHLKGKEYLKVWIQVALKTVKNTLVNEGSSFGSEHHSLIGTTFKPQFTKSEYERMIKEALIQNDAINNVSNFSFDQVGSKMIISFDVDSIYGTQSEGVTI